MFENTFGSSIAPLHMCASLNHCDLIEVLLKANADVRFFTRHRIFVIDTHYMYIQINIIDSQGQSALHYAVKAGHVNTCRLLLKNKIDAFLVSSHGQTAMDMAPSLNIQELLINSKLVDEQSNEYNRIMILVRQHETVSSIAVTTTDLELQLLEASKSGDLDVVKVDLFVDDNIFVIGSSEIVDYFSVC
jgi:ankyrin repeat protein